jgi:DNA-binding NarL/FixJ family response regulator
MGQGRTTDQIAEAMHISPKTVETFQTRIQEKLDVTEHAVKKSHAEHLRHKNDTSLQYRVCQSHTILQVKKFATVNVRFGYSRG